MGADVSTEPKKLFISEDRTEEEIMTDYEKPLRSYPTISRAESKTGKDGLLYRDGLEVPFTGRLIGRFEDGSVSMEASYKDGLPHGQQIRRFPGGSPALEAIFDHGILSGVKTKWWGQGIIREEEYWSEGQYRGRRLWDQEGRLLREEIVPGS
jgi:antitoxin component YwqK of YwqJK toxin-antitoxin module